MKSEFIRSSYVCYQREILIEVFEVCHTKDVSDTSLPSPSLVKVPFILSESKFDEGSFYPFRVQVW